MAAVLSFYGVHSLLFFLFSGFLCFLTTNGMLGRGFGDHIDWKTYSEGLKEAESSHKPLMLIIHKSWCGACKALKPKFAESKEIEELSKKFVMINVEDDEEPRDSKFQIDGAYIPRIFILDSYGHVQKDIYNKKGNPSYKYYYGSPPGIVDSMKEALEKMIDGVRIGDEL
ncbi:thioredoxin domain-containing protein 12-like [Stylophora pistillata]|uniref:thioredoxin domain-containing protein 12-like n=1 Tax=Stylophora pistillata TaxID=50429 RepID=UPI000C039C3C|nr:thioredoxin domain-containing protein 12-like [Stylophora pistillata]